MKKMRAAVEIGDMTTLKKLLENLNDIDPNIKNSLRLMANNFEYEKLLDVL